MSTRLVQRAVVVALALAAAGAALAVHITSTNGLRDRRVDRLQAARHHVADALQRRTYFLEDLADMVGVHDDAAAAEFSRYAHVRGREERSLVSVQWVRRSPDGKLIPPAAPDPDPGATPMLIAPALRGNVPLADAARERAAAHAIHLASISKTVSVSAPVRLADGDAAFYLAVPVQGRKFSGLLSKAESESAIVGLVDAQTLLAQALGGGSPAFRLRDRLTPLASIGSGLHNALSAAVPAAGRRWTIAVEGGSLTSLQLALPWLILLLGAGLTTAVALILGNAARRRDQAMRLADERLGDLAVSLQRLELANDELELARGQAEARSRTDSLTEVANRRHFGEALERQLASDEGAQAAVLMIDIDHFKRINDEHGHLTGDVVLRVVAARIGSVLRADDCLARWGGEEFVVLAPGGDQATMIELAARVRRTLGAPIVVDGEPFQITVSIGAVLTGAGLDTAGSVVGAADQALYEAKRSGRDCVRVYARQDPAAARP